jgi:hypothetical protein
MQNTLRQALLFAIVMLLLGPIAGRLAAGMALHDGGIGGVIFSASASTGGALVNAALIVALATVAAALGAFLMGPRHALLAAGITLAWAAWATPDVDELFRRTRDGSVLMGLLADAALLGVLSIAGVLAALRLSREVPHRGHDIGPSFRAMLLECVKPSSVAPLLAMVIAGVLAGTVVARTPMAGQTFAAAAAAGLAGGAIARIVAQPVSLGPLLVGAMVVAIGCPAAGVALAGTSDAVVTRALAGALPALAWIKPWAALAGLLVGLPLGVTWAQEVAAKHHHAAPPPKPARRDDGVRIKRAAP